MRVVTLFVVLCSSAFASGPSEVIEKAFEQFPAGATDLVPRHKKNLLPFQERQARRAIVIKSMNAPLLIEAREVKPADFSVSLEPSSLYINNPNPSAEEGRCLIRKGNQCD